MKKLTLLSLIVFIATLAYRFKKQQTRKEIKTVKLQKTLQAPIVRPIIRLPIKIKKAITIEKKLLPKPLSGRFSKSLEDFEDEKRAPQDSEGNIYITQVILDDEYLIAHGDIIVGRSREVESYQSGDKKLIIYKPKLWTDNTIPYLLDNDLAVKRKVDYVLSQMVNKTNIKFIKRTDQKNYVRFKQGKQHCYSQVGMIGGEQIISLSERCDTGTIFHEVMHTLGFLHEQNRMDRDDYLQILWENIAIEYHPQFKKIQTNFWEKQKFKFTYKTIMLYPSKTFARAPDDYSLLTLDGDIIFENSEQITDIDIRRVNLLYPKK